MQEQNQIQQLNPNAQGVSTFFIPNVPQSVTAIQPNQQILLGQQNNFMRMPISSVSQWTVNNVLTTGALTSNINHHQVQGLQGPRILFSQSTNNDHFIMHNRTDLNNQTIGVNQRFIPAHSLVVTQQLPNQIKQFSVSPSIQIPIQNHNIAGLTQQFPRLTTAATNNNNNNNNNNLNQKEIFVNQVINTSLIDGSLIQTNNNNNNINEKNGISHDLQSSIGNSIQIDPKFHNSASPINYRRLLELAQTLDPLLQLDDDVQEIFNSFLEEILLHITERAVELAKLRKSTTLETKDFQYIFEHDWNIFVPGYQSLLEKPKKSTENEIHKLRMALIKKQCKK